MRDIRIYNLFPRLYKNIEDWYAVAEGSVFNFVSLPFHLIPEAGCGQSPQSLENTGNSGI